ncbi:MAG: RHS repeat-associated core domain-containing protein [Bacteroidales bacterium]|nr:RHS repeat-associated core domain-containing protein [Bacteroidales bacterium]
MRVQFISIRGWLTKINDPATVSNTGDLFGMELFYNNTDGSVSNNALFNGNISAIKWQTVQPTGVSTPVTNGLKAYKYTYDKLNRLLTGVYAENLDNLNNFSEYINTGSTTTGYRPYDLNGNIQTMKRHGLRGNVKNTIDELTYTYDGNKLIAVEDIVIPDNGGDFVDGNKYTGTAEYAYDKNGNLTKDLNKGILSITYNYLNLPVSINKTSDNRIEYTYDAVGNKRSQVYYVNNSPSKTTTFYTNFVYENYAPAWVNYDEGRLVLNSNGTSAINEAYLKDHLGNVRVAYYWAGSLKTQQVNSYYPFGLNIKGLSLNGSATYKPNEYLYNGKMMQDEMGLGWLDYGARFYDAVLGRWHSMDPLAEVNRRWSPYRYAYDNPMRFIDPDGMLEDLYLKGEEAQEAFRQLQQSTSLDLSMADDGKVSAAGEAQTKSDNQLLSAINDQNIDVTVTATNSLTLSDGSYTQGGAFMGNNVTQTSGTEILNGVPEEVPITKVSANQEVNPAMLNFYDQKTGSQTGSFILHEVTESYEGAKISQGTGVSALPAAKGNATYSSIFLPAHIAASNQPPINRTTYYLAQMYSIMSPILKNVLTW